MKLLFTCLLATLGLATACGQQNYENTDVQGFAELITDSNVVVLDVRRTDEFAEGHIQGAILIDQGQSDFIEKANQQFNWNGDFIFEPLSEKHTPDIIKRAYVGVWNGQRGVIRQYTPRECLRLMGFPDSFVMLHNDNVMWRQSGNSIVVNVLIALVNELIKTGVFDE